MWLGSFYLQTETQHASLTGMAAVKLFIAVVGIIIFNKRKSRRCEPPILHNLFFLAVAVLGKENCHSNAGVFQKPLPLERPIGKSVRAQTKEKTKCSQAHSAKGKKFKKIRKGHTSAKEQMHKMVMRPRYTAPQISFSFPMGHCFTISTPCIGNGV